MQSSKRIKKVVVRLTEEEDREVNLICTEENITKSNYIRQRVLSKNTGSDIIKYICPICTTITKLVEKYDINETDRNELGEEMEQLWQHLR